MFGPRATITIPLPIRVLRSTRPPLTLLVRWKATLLRQASSTEPVSAYTYQKVVLNPTGNYFVPSGLFNQAFNNGDNRLPGVSIGGYWSWLGVGAQPNYSKSGSGIFSDDFTFVKGRHVIQAGGFYMWNIIRLNASSFRPGELQLRRFAYGDVAWDFLLLRLPKLLLAIQYSTRRRVPPALVRDVRPG